MRLLSLFSISLRFLLLLFDWPFFAVLPWCVKLNAANLQCQYGQDVSPLPACLSVAADQLVGMIPSNKISGPIAGTKIAGALADSVTMNPSQLQCDEGQDPIKVPCLILTVDNFPNGQLPADVVIAGNDVEVSSLVCTDGNGLPDCVTINPDQIDGTIPATQLGTGYLTTSISCPGNGSSISSALPSCWTVNASQVSTGYLTTSLSCPANGSTSVLPSCWTIANRNLNNVSIDAASTFNGSLGSNTCSCVSLYI